MFRYIVGAFLLIQVLMQLALVESTDYSTRVEYKQVNTVPKSLHDKVLPFKLIGRKFYYIESKKHNYNWFQAAQECRNRSGNLINLTTDSERKLIGLSLDKSKKYWLDLSNLGQNEYFSIATGSKYAYAKWFNEDVQSSVNNVEKNRNCVLLVNDYQDGFVMKKTDCFERASFICQLSSPQTISFLIW
ncbi:C-type lectin 37Db-like [Drosophila innubila]|uniref:C-type lectin 37Db-like n=1 Tax=Drosophila innubila TaxID=198719 RepID=UPI00148E025C|nr:C-type lectin 37Db-like [Drosophila innubila]